MGSMQIRSRFRFGFGRQADDAAGLALPVLAGEEQETLFGGAEAIGTRFSKRVAGCSDFGSGTRHVISARKRERFIPTC
jgi:hypothetical protein